MSNAIKESDEAVEEICIRMEVAIHNFALRERGNPEQLPAELLAVADQAAKLERAARKAAEEITHES